MVYLFLAEGFEEIEALTPVDILRRGKVELKTVGVGGKEIKGSHGITVRADISDKELVIDSSIEAVILPGGMPGTLNLEASQTVISTVKFCADNKKIIGAICAAPSILGHLGLLSGRQATAFPGFEAELKGTLVSSDPFVAVDGNFITARGMGVSVDFGLELLRALRGSECSDKVRSAIQCRI